MTIVCGLQLVETRTLTNLQVNNTSWPGSKFRLPLPRGVSCNSHFLLFKSRRLYEVTPEGKFFFTSLMTASSFSARKTTILRTMRQNKIRAGAALNLLNMPHNSWNCTRYFQPGTLKAYRDRCLWLWSAIRWTHGKHGWSLQWCLITALSDTLFHPSPPPRRHFQAIGPVAALLGVTITRNLLRVEWTTVEFW